MTGRTERALLLAWYLAPLVEGLSSLIWIGTGTTLLYTQDSVNYFLQPFSYGNNPLYPATFAYGANLVHFALPDLFLDSFSGFLLQLRLAPGTVERIGIVTIVVVSNYGYFLLFDEIGRDASQTRNTATVAGAILGSLLFLLNPYTLTVTWWHFLPWSLFMAGLPFLFLVVVLIGRMHLRDPRLYLGLLVLVLLAPGFYGPYATSTLAVFVIFLAAYSFNDWLNGHVGKTTVARICAYFGGFLAIAWASLAYLVTIQSAYASVYLSGLSQQGQIQSLLQAESATTQLSNVLRLIGFSWLYQGNGGRSYPWFSYFPIVAAASWIVPVIWIYGATYIRRHPVFIPIYATSIVAILFSLGTNPPSGALNEGLVQIGGPFYIVLSAYYFIGQFYVLVVALSSSLIFKELVTLYLHRSKIQLDSTIPSANQRPERIGRRFTSIWRNRGTVVAVVSVLAALLIIVSSAPFLSQRLYTSQGSFADEFSLPPSFDALKNYFAQNYTGPLYYVLVVPLSQTTGPDLQFGNGSFPDSSNLFQDFIPYPVIDHVDNPATTALDNLISSNNFSYVSPILEGLHIKYVVFNPFYNGSAWWMSTSPDGGHLNLTTLSQKLAKEGASMTEVDRFSVFDVLTTRPLAEAFKSFPGFAATDYLSYLQTLSTIDPVSNVSSAISDSIFVAQNNSTLPSAHYSPLSGYSSTMVSCNGSSDIYTQSVDGNLEPFLTRSAQGSCSVGGPNFITGLRNQSAFTTDLHHSAGSYINPLGNTSYISSTGLVNTPGASRISLVFGIPQISNLNWVNVWLFSKDGNLNVSAVFAIYNGTGSRALQASYFLNGALAEWTHADLALPLSGITGIFNITLTNTTAVAALSIGNSVTSEMIYTGEVQQPPGGGVNTSLEGREVSNAFSDYRLNVSFVNLEATLGNLTILSPNLDQAALSVPPAMLASNPLGPSATEAGVSYTINLPANAALHYYVVLFTPEFSLVSVTGAASVQRVALPDYNVFAVVSGPSGSVTIIMVTGSTVGPAAIIGVVEAVGFATLAVVFQFASRRGAMRRSIDALARLFAR
jgi:hypothetical protein